MPNNPKIPPNLDKEFENKQIERKRKQKKAFDLKQARATAKKGLAIVYTGQGKGKSTAAFGMLARALFHDMQTAVFQFVKGKIDSAERSFFKQFSSVDFYTADDGFTWLNEDLAKELSSADALWHQAKKILNDARYDFVLLDEINIMLHYKYLTLEDVLQAIAARPPMQHVILTGRHAPQALIDACDLVSNVQMVKHPFHGQHVKAQAGIEF